MFDRSVSVILALSASWLLPSGALSADLTFTGNLRFVTKTSITVRLADGRVIDARLPNGGSLASDAIVAQYKLADQVQISCKGIRTELDKQYDRYHTLELTRIRFLRSPTPQEVLRVNTSNSWQSGENLLKPSSVISSTKPPALEVPKEFKEIRVVNLAYIRALPNFTADEVAVRSRKPKGSEQWKAVDTIESEISFKGQDASRQHIRINGKPWNSPSSWLPGPNWGIGFGSELKPLFDPECENEITLEGQKEAAGKLLASFAFRSPMDGCFGPGTLGYEQIAAEHTGHILVDPEGHVIQLVDVAGSISVLTWDQVKIGDSSHLLPVGEDWTWRAPDGGALHGDTWHVAVQYKNHRHFEAAINLRFTEDATPRK
jgi:hypothetical protein